MSGKKVRRRRRRPSAGGDASASVRSKSSSSSPEPADRDLLNVLARTRTETARLVRGLEAHRQEAEVLLKEINRHELDLLRLLRGLVGVLDTFDRLLVQEGTDVKLYRASVHRTAEALMDVLTSNSALELIGRAGETAHPATHRVIEVRDEDGLPPDTVIKVVERGIRYGGELFRPASVIVSSGKER